MTDPLALDPIRARVEAATSGPWRTDKPRAGTGKNMVVREYDFLGRQYVTIVPDIDGVDADFIAAARTDIPALLAEVDRLRDVIGRVRELTGETSEARWLRELNRMPGGQPFPRMVAADDIEAILSEADQ